MKGFELAKQVTALSKALPHTQLHRFRGILPAFA